MEGYSREAEFSQTRLNTPNLVGRASIGLHGAITDNGTAIVMDPALKLHFFPETLRLNVTFEERIQNTE